MRQPCMQVMFASLSLISSMASFRQRMVAEHGLTETAVSTPKGCGDNAMCKASMVRHSQTALPLPRS